MKGDALGEFIGVLVRMHEQALGLVVQLVHRRLAGAGDGLIRAHHHPLDRVRRMQRGEGDDHLDGRAIRVGDDVAVAEIF